MENHEKEIDLVELLKVLWKNRSKIVIFGAVGFIVGVIIAFSIPKIYNTTVKITPEDATASGMGDMGSLAGMVGINLGGASGGGITSMIYPDVVQSSPFLLEFAEIEVVVDDIKMPFYQYVTEEQKQPWWGYIIAAPGACIGFVSSLFSDKEPEIDSIDLFKPSLKQKQYIKFLHSNISIAADKKTNILTLGVNMQDPVIAAVIADSLLCKLQVYMTEYRTNKARKDLNVKEIMLEDARYNYFKAEDALAKGMDINRNITSKKGEIKISRLANEKDLAFTVYKELATQVEVEKIRLQDSTPIATIIEPASVAVKASSPSKALIAIAFAFLGGCIASGLIFYKEKIFSL